MSNEDPEILANVEQMKALLPPVKTWRSRLYGSESVRVFIGKDRLFAFVQS